MEAGHLPAAFSQRGRGAWSRSGPDPPPPWALQVMESVVKNCGQTVHDEVANKQTMEELKELLKVRAPLGAWVQAGRGAATHPPGLCFLGHLPTPVAGSMRGAAEAREASVGSPCCMRTPNPNLVTSAGLREAPGGRAAGQVLRGRAHWQRSCIYVSGGLGGPGRPGEARSQAGRVLSGRLGGRGDRGVYGEMVGETPRGVGFTSSCGREEPVLLSSRHCPEQGPARGPPGSRCLLEEL